MKIKTLTNEQIREIIVFLKQNAKFDADAKNFLILDDISMIYPEYFENKWYKVFQIADKLSNNNYVLDSDDCEQLRKINLMVVPNYFSGEIIETDNKKATTTTTNNNSFVAISDFHSYEYPLEKIKNYYLNEYDVVYILGDMTDRGPNNNGKGGIDLLREVKKLSEQFPGRVVYIPGNHDSFIVGYDLQDKNSKKSLEINHGTDTIKELENLSKNNPIEYSELIEWLKYLPLQRKHNYNGKTYALAHAFFNDTLYNENKTYCLYDYFNDYSLKNEKIFKLADDVLWFRIDSDSYNREDCVNSDTICIIGHTPTKEGSREHDLVDRNGNKVTVHCVDGGIYKGRDMLKYDGGSKTDATLKFIHNDTSQKIYNNTNEEEINEITKSLFYNGLIRDIYVNGENAFNSVDIYNVKQDLLANLFYDYIKQYNLDIKISDFFYLYKKILIVDNIIESDYDKYHNYKSLCSGLDSFMFGEDLNMITRNRDARFFAKELTADGMKEVLQAHNCNSISEYINLKTKSHFGIPEDSFVKKKTIG